MRRFRLVVPKRKIAVYRDGDRAARCGAITARSTTAKRGDDLREDGPAFPKLARPDGDTVGFLIVYKSRAHRDKVNAKVMKDPRLKMTPKEMPFDMKRMAYGGFKTLVEF